MKMDVVLSSPGHYGEDGTPFKNEEIREWSRVDRLTGMLERARIETGRWQASNDASRHSYGKVSDQRERNSADGSVMQKARRQVEIFQSQEPGRSVQVFRASQWSSSRVTDAIEDGILPGSENLLNGINDALTIDPWKFPSLSLSPSPDIESSSFDHPFLHIRSLKDCRNFEKNLLSKRSNSDEDLSSLVGSNGSSRLSTGSFTRDCMSRRSLQIPNSVPVNTSSSDNSQKPFATTNNSPPVLSTSSPHAASVRIGDQPKSSDYGSLRHRAAPNRPNAVTVVNLMNPEAFQDDSSSKKSIVTLRASPVMSQDSLGARKVSLTKTNSSGDEGIVGLPARAVKKVGFCKTEVHFAADSGKVNIVETDGKPPPTNKFRRRRRNQNQPAPTIAGYATKSPLEPGGLTNGRIISRRTIVRPETSADLEPKKFWATPEDLNDGRPHTTTVNVGKANGRHKRELEELKTPEELASPKAVSEVISQRISEKDSCNIITKDSENNRVLSTIVKTHESTTARVEDKLPKLEPLQKKKATKTNSNKSVNKSSSAAKENHVYVNVFKTLDSKFPIYENYRVDNSKDKTSLAAKPQELSSLVSEVTKNLKNTLERKRGKAKSPIKLGKRSPGSISRSTISNGSIGKTRPQRKATEATKSMEKSSSTNSTSKRSETGSTRSKKQPMEVVYETAVYNMKNEKLSKATKGKNTKAGPRYINDLICGSKTNRTNNTKRKGSTTSQAS